MFAMPGGIALPVSPGSPGPSAPVAGSDAPDKQFRGGRGRAVVIRGLILSVRSRAAYRHSPPARPRKHQAIVAKWTEALDRRLRYCEISEFAQKVYIYNGQSTAA